MADGGSFKALSRMSSFPTRSGSLRSTAACWFQSAVAHELISNYIISVNIHWALIVSKRCRA